MRKKITLLTLVFCCPALAQNYSAIQFTVAGGGGTSTNAQYCVTGTMGSGRYSVTGGFWSLFAAIQTPGAPLLQIINTGTNAVAVVWPSTPTTFILQQNTDLNTTNWVSVGAVPNDDGAHKSVIISPAAGTRLFRLKWP